MDRKVREENGEECHTYLLRHLLLAVLLLLLRLLLLLATKALGKARRARGTVTRRLAGRTCNK